MNKKPNILAIIFWGLFLGFILAALLLAAGILSVSAESGPVGLIAHPNVAIKIGGGDCSADNARSDLHSPRDFFYCEATYRLNPSSSSYIMETMVPAEAPQTLTVISTPKQGDNSGSEATQIAPESDDTGKPLETVEPRPTKPVETPEPNPTKEPTAGPTQDAPEENEETCHPNAGRGNGSEDCDGDGEDDDPGNSGGHNGGGD